MLLRIPSLTQIWIPGFADESALLKHELAYVLGQKKDERALPVLTRVLEDTGEDPMVRHEVRRLLAV